MSVELRNLSSDACGTCIFVDVVRVNIALLLALFLDPVISSYSPLRFFLPPFLFVSKSGIVRCCVIHKLCVRGRVFGVGE